jgi:hypothetical protein
VGTFEELGLGPWGRGDVRTGRGGHVQAHGDPLCVSAMLVLAGTSSMLGSHIGSRKTLIYLLRCLHSTFVSARREDISLDTLGKILYWCCAPLIPSDGRLLL